VRPSRAHRRSFDAIQLLSQNSRSSVASKRGCSSRKYSLARGTLTIRRTPPRFSRSHASEPAVLGKEKCRESDQSYYLAAMKVAVQAAIDPGQLAAQPVDPIANLILGALTEAAMLVARADDKAAARREVSAAITRIFEGLSTR
jgi:hypothetical protein